jgi:Spy/CpxP family protein refolding chaperone
LIGSVSGYTVATRSQAGRFGWRQTPDWKQQWIQQRFQQDCEALNATPEQREKLRPVYDRMLADLNAIQSEAASKVRDVFTRYGRSMGEVLTPEQHEEFRLIRKARAPQRSKPAP